MIRFTKRCLGVILWTLFLSSIEAVEKSSLTFAIDDTWSMRDDIDAVKLSANAIFDTVTNSNASFIEDFVLVTINDPEVIHVVTTSDRDQYRTAIMALTPHAVDNYDCPEMSMSGIELALQKSRPGSLLYVFTDASAKDPEKHESVKNLAHRKSIQVVFVLTGDCSDRSYTGNSEVYDQVAQETSGIVFNIYKNQTNDILTYVQSQINTKKIVLAKKLFSPGTNEFAFEVDSKMKELVIAVSGQNPTLIVTDPAGGRAPMEKNQTNHYAFVKITTIYPGTYTAEVTSDSKNSVLITAEASVHFVHGFSTFVPLTMKDTATRPLPDEESYISIKLEAEGSDNVVLDTVQIIDLENNIIEEKPLRLSDDKELYISTTTFIPPAKNTGSSPLFRVAINCHDTKSNESFTRLSLTPIETQSIGSSVSNKKPDVTVIGETSINAEYNETLVLKCKVKGYPKPQVKWRTNDGALLHSTLTLVEHPYDYISTLSIDRVVSNITYQCFAKNYYGEDSKEIQVETVRKTYFDVIKKPKDTEIEIYTDAQIECEVDAYPPAEIDWYKNRKVLSEDDNIKISPNRSLLLIKNMQPYMKGKYSCIARNENKYRLFFFRVHISGAESPTINKTLDEYRLKDGASVEIHCPVTHGKPKPTITWYFEGSDGTEYQLEDSKDNETIVLTNITRDSTRIGSYRCEARNDVGFDFHRIQLIMEYPPQIMGEKTAIIESKVGEKQNMECVVDGKPTPSVRWLLNDTELILTTRHGRAYRTHGFNFYVTESDTGIYICQATNKHGTVNKTIDLRIFRPATIKIPSKTTFDVMVGDNLELPCQADGYPKPDLKWVFYTLEPALRRVLRPNVPSNLSLRRVQIKDEGYYVCSAHNKGGSFNIAYEVKVFAPPAIKNIYPEKTFKAVIGDMALRIPCKATGRPIPQITWVKDGQEKVAAGTDLYDIDDDGTLIINEIDKQSAGTYVCEARNSVGSSTELYEVVVDAYPNPGVPTSYIAVAVTTSEALTCNVHHKNTDRFRWFKDGRVVSFTKQHHIIDAKMSDAGIYTCRVSNEVAKARSGHIQVIVGFKPEFLYVEKENIEFEEGVSAIMDCSAHGYPKPEISWFYQGELLPVTDMTFIFDMDLSNRGEYSCSVKNYFGEINRMFVIR